MEIKELSRILQENGIVGAGGAGFPSYAKLSAQTETLILNCAECEPLLRLHRQLLERYADEITRTFHMMGQTLGVKEIIIGIKETYQNAIEALEEYLFQYPEMRLGLLTESYPAGDEVVLIYEMTGKVVRPGGVPIESGVAVFNVETIYNVYQAINFQKPVTDKLVSVVGEVAHPITVRVPVGCTVKEVVSLAGGALVEDPVYWLGGPMMGYIGSASLPVTKTTNAVIVLPQDHFLVQKKRSKASIDLKRAAAACCQCTMCTDLCPRNLLGHPVEPHKFMLAATCKDMQSAQVYLDTMFCSSCGLCELYSCMQGLSPRTLLTEYKSGLRKAGIKPPSDAKIMPVRPQREYQKVPMKRLISRLDLIRYDKTAPLDEKSVSVRKVKILFSQHIGVPAVAAVKCGDMVKKDQVVGIAGKGLSVFIHASIDGKVVDVNEKYVIIEHQEGRANHE